MSHELKELLKEVVMLTCAAVIGHAIAKIYRAIMRHYDGQNEGDNE